MNLSKKHDPRFRALWLRSGAVGRFTLPINVETIAKIDYTKTAVPANYKCVKCGAIGCKLWRDSGPFSTCQLLCCDCAAKEADKDIGNMDDGGKFVDPKDEFAIKSDNIGIYVPAVPDEQGTGYWGYMYVPRAGCEWWRKLPTRPNMPIAA